MDMAPWDTCGPGTDGYCLRISRAANGWRP